MRKLVVLAAAFASIAVSIATAAPPPPNPQIDMAGFLADAHAAARERESRRVDEATFVRMMREPDTVVIDARSRAMFERRHIAGAVSLSFPDFTAETLARAIPHPTTRVLIYCNNNFASDLEAFPAQGPPGVAQPVDLGRAAQLRLPQRLRARAVPRRAHDRASARDGAAPLKDPSAEQQHRHLRRGEHLGRHRAHHEVRDRALAMRAHDDHVAAARLRMPDDLRRRVADQLDRAELDAARLQELARRPQRRVAFLGVDTSRPFRARPRPPRARTGSPDAR
jgi:hypothetical protein